MAREIHYAKLADTREERDRLAIADIKSYLPPRAWKTVIQMLEDGNIEAVNFGLGIAGVSGYPFHALCRRYALGAYREWMHGGDDAVLTDEQGFPLEDS